MIQEIGQTLAARHAREDAERSPAAAVTWDPPADDLAAETVTTAVVRVRALGTRPPPRA